MANKMSLYTLTTLLLRFASNGNTKEEYYEDILSLGNFKEDIQSGITEKRCKNLGKKGWTVCPFWEMDAKQGETIIETWEDKINRGHGDKIAQYFIDDNYALLKTICGRINLDLISLNTNDYNCCFAWLKEATSVFFDKYYLSCAMILTALLERLIRTHPRADKIVPMSRNTNEFFNVTSKTEMSEVEAKDRYDTISFLYEKYYFLPSLEGFIQTYYTLPGYRLEKGIEPEALIRNWLMHGLTKIKVGEVECIKLFNAICTFLSIRSDLSTY